MTDSLLKSLSAAVEQDPRDRANAGLMEELVSEALELLGKAAGPELRERVLETSELAQRWRGAIGESREAWTAWYAGQLQCVASLLHASLVRELPGPTLAMLRRKHVPALLEALEQGDKTLSDLADAVGIDLSQADREVTRMADRDLVHTMKEGRARWVTLTSQGHRVLDKRRSGHIQASGLGWTASAPQSAAAAAPILTLSQALVDATRALTAQQAEMAQTSRATHEVVRESAAVVSQTVRELASRTAPQLITTIKIPVERIRAVVGPGGETIQSIAERTGSKIDVDDAGRVWIASMDESAAKTAVAMIDELTAPATAELNKTYLGEEGSVADEEKHVESRKERFAAAVEEGRRAYREEKERGR